MKVRTFTAVIHKEDNLYVAECLEVGTVSQGATIEEAIANLKEATDSVRHTRAIQRDRTNRPLAAPPDEQVTARLTEIVHPANAGCGR